MAQAMAFLFPFQKNADTKIYQFEAAYVKRYK